MSLIQIGARADFDNGAGIASRSLPLLLLGARLTQRLELVRKISVADIAQPELITRILDHIQNRDPPQLSPQRAMRHFQPNDLFADG